MVIVDSSVWIDLFAGHDTAQMAILREVSSRDRLGIGDLMICEVLRGIKSPRRFRELRAALLALEVHHIGGAALAVAAAMNYRTLRQRGITVRGTIDCLIATYCIEGGHALLHNDRDFDPFEQHLGLVVAG